MNFNIIQHYSNSHIAHAFVLTNRWIIIINYNCILLYQNKSRNNYPLCVLRVNWYHHSSELNACIYTLRWWENTPMNRLTSISENRGHPRSGACTLFGSVGGGTHKAEQYTKTTQVSTGWPIVAAITPHRNAINCILCVSGNIAWIWSHNFNRMRSCGKVHSHIN